MKKPSSSKKETLAETAAERVNKEPHRAADLLRELASATSSAPSHVDPGGVEDGHAVEALIEVLNALVRLRREVLEGVHGCLALTDPLIVDVDELGHLVVLVFRFKKLRRISIPKGNLWQEGSDRVREGASDAAARAKGCAKGNVRKGATNTKGKSEDPNFSAICR